MRGKIKETNDANVHFTSILFQIKPIEITMFIMVQSILKYKYNIHYKINKFLQNYCKFLYLNKGMSFLVYGHLLLSKIIRHPLCADTVLGARAQRLLRHNFFPSRDTKLSKNQSLTLKSVQSNEEDRHMKTNITNITGATMERYYRIQEPGSFRKIFLRMFEMFHKMRRSYTSEWVMGEVVLEAISESWGEEPWG